MFMSGEPGGKVARKVHPLQLIALKLVPTLFNVFYGVELLSSLAMVFAIVRVNDTR
jgi:hypothetical protein